LRRKQQHALKRLQHAEAAMTPKAIGSSQSLRHSQREDRQRQKRPLADAENIAPKRVSPEATAVSATANAAIVDGSMATPDGATATQSPSSEFASLDVGDDELSGIEVAASASTNSPPSNSGTVGQDADDEAEFSDCDMDLVFDDSLFDEDDEPATLDTAQELALSRAFFRRRPSGYCPLRVLSISDNESGATKTLTCANQDPLLANKPPCSVRLRGLWYDSPVEVGDLINVVEYASSEPISSGDERTSVPVGSGSEIVVVDDIRNLLVLHPDMLLSPSRISQCFPCMRKGVLGEVSPGGAPSKAAIMGTLKHEMFEALVQGERCPSASMIASTAHRVATSHFDLLYAIELSQTECETELRSAGHVISSWMRQYLGLPLSDSSQPYLAKKSFSGKTNSVLKILRTKACEESIWSPKWGLKGFVDATVEVAIESNDIAHVLDSRVRATMPLELKTGRQGASNSTSHRAQLQLYSLMVADRYSSEQRGKKTLSAVGPRTDQSGFLLYISTQAAQASQLSQIRQTQEEIAIECVPFRAPEVRSLIAARNRMATHLRNLASPADSASASTSTMVKFQLPKMIRATSKECSKCYQREVCTLMHAALEGGSASSSRMDDAMWNETTRHLSPAATAYFQRWMQLVYLEMYSGSAAQQVILSQSGSERESATSDCLAHMACVSVTKHHNMLTFSRAAVSSSALPNSQTTPLPAQKPSLTNSPLKGFASGTQTRFNNGCEDLRSSTNIRVGDRVVLSVEWFANDGTEENVAVRPVHTAYGIAVGYVKAVQESAVKIQVNTHIPAEFTAAHVNASQSPKRLWRIDRDTYFSNMRLVVDNITRLFAVPGVAANNSWNKTRKSKDESTTVDLAKQVDDKRRRLVVDLEPPQFRSGMDFETSHFPWHSQFQYPDSSPRNIACLAIHRQKQRVALTEEFKTLNQCQREAVCRALAARDYLLVEGMPGTGKTRLISFLVRVLLFLGESVLISSYTNTGVDNLLLKIIDDVATMDTYSIVRIGSEKRVHPQVRQFCLERQLQSTESSQAYASSPSLSAYTKLLNSAQLVATTCLGVRHSLFDKRRFDYCVVDEAGQITEPVVLGPLRACNAFVLVGDHKQLPPLVTNPIAVKGGMDVSLFKKLCDKAHPDATVALTTQYRMNSEIMRVSNSLIYDNTLECGTRGVASRRLQLPHFHRVRSIKTGETHVGRSWLEAAVEPQAAVVFLNLQPAPERSHSSPAAAQDSFKTPVRRAWSNTDKPEAYAARGVVRALVLAGADPSSIGLISPYRNQLKLLQRAVNDDFPDVEIMTVDSYQGRDKEVIVLSLVCPAGNGSPSNRSPRIGNLLKDKRRLNVAMTRAKSKLVILGSVDVLAHSNVPLLEGLVKLCRQHHWVVDIAPGRERTSVPRVLPADTESMISPTPDDEKRASASGNFQENVQNMSDGRRHTFKVFKPPAEKYMQAAVKARSLHSQGEQQKEAEPLNSKTESGEPVGSQADVDDSFCEDDIDDDALFQSMETQIFSATLDF